MAMNSRFLDILLNLPALDPGTLSSIAANNDRLFGLLLLAIIGAKAFVPSKVDAMRGHVTDFIVLS